MYTSGEIKNGMCHIDFTLSNRDMQDGDVFQKSLGDKCRELQQQLDSKVCTTFKLHLPSWISSDFRKRAIHVAMLHNLESRQEGLGNERHVSISSRTFASEIERKYIRSMSSALRFGDFEQLIREFGKFRGSGSPPSRHAYNILLDACSQVADSRSAEATVDSMRANQVSPDPYAIQKLVAALSRAGRIHDALKVVAGAALEKNEDGAPRHDLDLLYGMILRGCQQHGDLEQAVYVADRIDPERHGIDVRIQLLKVFGMSKDADRVAKLGLEMHGPAISGTHSISSWASSLQLDFATLGAQCQCHSLGDALQSLERIFRIYKDLKIWSNRCPPYIDSTPTDYLRLEFENCCYEVMCLLGEFQPVQIGVANAIVDYGRALGMRFSGKVVSGLLRVHMQHAAVERAGEERQRNLIDRNLDPKTEKACNHFLHHLDTLRDELVLLRRQPFAHPWEVAENAIEEMKKLVDVPNAATCKSILLALSLPAAATASTRLASKNIGTAIDFILWLQKAGFQVKLEFLHVVLSGCIVNGTFPLAIQTAQSLLSRSLAPSSGTFVLLFRAVAKFSAQPESIRQDITSGISTVEALMKKHNVPHTLATYNLRIQSLEDDQEIVKTIRDMRSKGVRPNHNTYRQAICRMLLFYSASRFQNALALFAQMRQNGFLPSIKIWNALMIAGANLDNFGSTYTLWEQLEELQTSADTTSQPAVSPNLETISAVISALLQARPNAFEQRYEALVSRLNNLGHLEEVELIEQGRIVEVLPKLQHARYPPAHPIWNASASRKQIEEWVDPNSIAREVAGTWEDLGRAEENEHESSLGNHLTLEDEIKRVMVDRHVFGEANPT